MSELRRGTVACIDIKNQVGVIVDENAQDINFELKNQINPLKVDDEVYFEIILADDGLKAINISLR